MAFPTEEELVQFIKKKDFVNFTMIAKQFNIQKVTVSDIIASLVQKKLVKVKKIGGSKMVVIT